MAGERGVNISRTPTARSADSKALNCSRTGSRSAVDVGSRSSSLAVSSNCPSSTALPDLSWWIVSPSSTCPVIPWGYVAPYTAGPREVGAGPLDRAEQCADRPDEVHHRRWLWA